MREIHLHKTGQLEGLVVDESGQPIADAQVRTDIFGDADTFDPDVQGCPNLDWFVANTGKDGRFVLSGVPADMRAEFIVRAAGHGTVATQEPDQAPQFQTGQKDIRIVLPPQCRVEGVVIDKSTGKPVADVQLIAFGGHVPDNSTGMPPSSIGFITPPGLAKADKDGRFVMEALEPGRWTVALAQQRMIECTEPAQWVAQPVVVDLAAGKSQSIRVELSRGETVEVALVDAATGAPVRGRLSTFAQKEAMEVWSAQVSDDKGIVHLRLLPGRYTLFASDYPNHVVIPGQETPRRFHARMDLTVEPGKSQHVQVQLSQEPATQPAKVGPATQPAAQPPTQHAEGEEPGDETVARVYDLRDLVAKPDANTAAATKPAVTTESAATTQPAKWPSNDALIAFIKANVDPNSWAPAGNGTVREASGMIVISQTRKNQVAIDGLIWQQRERLAGREGKIGHLVGRRFPLRFVEGYDACLAITKRLNVTHLPARIHLGGDKPGEEYMQVYATAEDMKKVAAWIAELDVPAATEPAKAPGGELPDGMIRRVYDVRDLVVPKYDYVPAGVGWITQADPNAIAKVPAGPPKEQLIEDLETLVIRSADKASWKQFGGRGTIQILQGDVVALVITQTPENHEKISKLIASLRREGSRQILVEARFIMASSPETAKRLEDSLRRNTELTFQKGQLGLIVSDKDANGFYGEAGGKRDMRVLAAPRITLSDGQRAFISILADKQIELPELNGSGKPEKIVFRRGTVFDVEGKISPDSNSVTMTFTASTAECTREATPVEIALATAHATISVPARQVLIIKMPLVANRAKGFRRHTDADGKMVTTVVQEPIPAREPGGAVYVLVKPTILKPEDYEVKELLPPVYELSRPKKQPAKDEPATHPASGSGGQVLEGVGHKGLIVGMSVQEVLDMFGPPDKRQDSDKTHVWLQYRQSRGIDILFIDGKAREIRFDKGFAATLSRGAGIGTPMETVLKTYGQPIRTVVTVEEKFADYGDRVLCKSDSLLGLGGSSKIEYTTKGVLFRFDTEGKVKQFVVFAPYGEPATRPATTGPSTRPAALSATARSSPPASAPIDPAIAWEAKVGQTITVQGHAYRDIPGVRYLRPEGDTYPYGIELEHVLPDLRGGQLLPVRVTGTLRVRKHTVSKEEVEQVKRDLAENRMQMQWSDPKVGQIIRHYYIPDAVVTALPVATEPASQPADTAKLDISEGK